jgi:MtaA/CmuA family methyltransferase
MNGRERYIAVVKGRPVDFLPRIPILMQYAAEHIGENYMTFASDFQVLVRANLECAQHFGMDQVSAISDPYRETHGFGAEVIFHKEGPPSCPPPPLENTKDFSMLKNPDPFKDERMLDRINAIRAYQQQAGNQFSIMGWIEGPAAEAADLRGVNNFLLDLMDDEAYTCELMNLCTKVGIGFGVAQIEAGADTIGIGDAIASQLSPKIYERMVLPREKKMVDAIHQAGGLVRLHICGNITHLLPGIAELGADTLDVDHMVDMSVVRKAVGEKVVLAGNLDPVGAILEGGPDMIRKRLREIYQQVGNPYMVAAGCEVPARTPTENLKALCEPVPFSGKIGKN